MGLKQQSWTLVANKNVSCAHLWALEVVFLFKNKLHIDFFLIFQRSKWYYPSHGDDLELEGDKVIKTPPEENRRRRTIILYKLNNSWGFTIQVHTADNHVGAFLETSKCTIYKLM